MDNTPNDPIRDTTSLDDANTTATNAAPTTSFGAVDPTQVADGTHDIDDSADSPTPPHAPAAAPDDGAAGTERRRNRRRSILTGVAAGVVGVGLGAGAFALGSSQLDGHDRGAGHMMEADDMPQGRAQQFGGQMQDGRRGGHFGGQMQGGQMQQGGQFGGTGGFQMPQGGGPVQGRTGAS